MRRAAVLGVVLVALGVLGWFSSRGSIASLAPRARAPSQENADWLWQALSRPAVTAPTAPARSIHGRVRGPHGPVAGAVILASRAVPGESLSALPCTESTEESEHLTVLTCQDSERLEELVARRQGEVPVLARALSAGDGSFTLEGLEAGAYALWAEGPEGTGLVQDVEAGRRDVELSLGAGVRLTGTVLSEGNRPVPGALVTAIFTAHSRFFETVSDASGHFELGPLPRGDYVLLGSKEGLLTWQQPLTAYAPQLQQHILLSQPRSLSGHVTRGGRPVKGARVRAQVADRLLQEGLSNAEGHFTLEGLPSWESFSLFATQGDEVARLEVDFEDPRGSPSLVLDSHPEVSLELAPGVEVRGRVLDEDRRPIAGVSVSLRELSEDDYGFVASARTDESGRYALGLARPGLLTLEVSARGWLRAREDMRRTLPAGVSTWDLSLSRGSVVEGVLLDTQGRPVADASLTLSTLVDSTSPELELSEASQVAVTFSGAEGHFLLNAPQPGPYRLEVRGDSIRDWTQDVSAPSSLRPVVESLPELEGEVVDGTGQLVPHAEVSLWPDGPVQDKAHPARVTTDTRGRFSLHPDEPGHYRLAAEFQQKDVVHQASRAVEVTKGGTHVQLRFEPGAALSGVVVDARGRPVPEAFVFITPRRHVRRSGCSGPPPGGGGGVTTDDAGRFTFQEVTGEELKLGVYASKYWLRAETNDEPRDTLALEPGAREVRVVLIRPASVHGRLVRADGSPITGFLLNGHKQEDDSGEFSWPILGTGTLELELSAPELPGAAGVRRSVPVQEEVEQDLGTIVLGTP